MIIHLSLCFHKEKGFATHLLIILWDCKVVSVSWRIIQLWGGDHDDLQIRR